MADFLPRSEGLLLMWLENFGRRIDAAPEDFGITPQQAAEFQSLLAAFAHLYQLAQQPATRTPAGVVGKDTAKAAVVAMARRLAALAQASADVTDAQRVLLGLRLRWSDRRRHVPPPPDAPGVRVRPILGRNAVRVQVYDTTAAFRVAKPRSVASAVLFTHVGEAPPSADTPWTFYAQPTRTTAEIDFPPGLPMGTRVWVMAQWCSPTNQRSPASEPRPIRLAGNWGAAA